MTNETTKIEIKSENNDSGWKKLNLRSLEELSLDRTLRCGQSFRWKKIGAEENDSTVRWAGVIGDTGYILKESDNDVVFKTFSSNRSKDEQEEEKRLRHYLHLDRELKQLWDSWCEADPRFKTSSVSYGGLRMLRQEPRECLFSFICSQNNNIGRITKMVDGLCNEWGDFVGEAGKVKFYTFPTLESLSKVEEEKLREMGFGYRARYIVTAANQIIEKGGDDWLQNLVEEKSSSKVRKELLTLMGIGKKVADCVSLFSMEKFDVVPVDTHVWQIAQEYMPKLRGKKLTDELYEEVGKFFKDKFGEHCGWAHSVLFASDLSFFKKELEELDKNVKEEAKEEENAKKEGDEKKAKKAKAKRIRNEEKIKEEIEGSVVEETVEAILSPRALRKQKRDSQKLN